MTSAVLRNTQAGELVLCDVDGVLLDFVGGLIEKMGVSWKLEDVTGWDTCFTLLGTEGAAYAKGSLLRTRSFWRDLKPLPGAVEMVAKFKTAGREFKVVSSPWHTYSEWESVRREVLEERFGLKHGDFASVPSGMKHLISGAVLVEDNLETAQAWARYHGRFALLLDAPYNRANDLGIHRVRNPLLTYLDA